MGLRPSPDDVVLATMGAMVGRARAQHVPLTGSIAMTHRCHLRCVHCYLGDERDSASEEETTAFWLSVIDQLADAGCLNLLITGGEPLLRRDFPEVYAQAARRGMLVTVFTNATLVDEQTVSLFEQMTPELVEVSLYGASSAVFERITRVPGSYRRCLAGIDRLLARGIPVGLKTVVMRENVHEVRAMRRMAEERRLPFRLDAAIFPCRDGCRTPLEHRVPAEEAVALEMEDEALLTRTIDYFQRMRGTAPDDHVFVCGAGLTAFHVDAAGMLWPCLMASTHGFDLRRGSFREGWENVLPVFREQKVEVGYRCHQCEKRFLCGLCPAQTAMETGDPQRRAEYLCALGEARWRRIQPFLDK